MNRKHLILIIIILIEIAIANIVAIFVIQNLNDKYNNIDKRLKDLEKDYKIYELHLQNLEENKEVHFEQRRN